MNPFDLPPSGDPVSVDGPRAPERSRRGRTALVAVVTLGLVGAGVAGVSQFASADRPDLAAAAQDEPDDTIAPPDDPVEDPTVDPADDGSGDDPAEPSGSTDGEIVIDVGDGEPVVIDLGELDADRITDLTECAGLPSFDPDTPFGEFGPGDFPLDLGRLLDDLPLDALDDLEGDWLEQDWPTELGGFDLDGGSVTIVGPDGVSVVDLGDNGSVAVTSDDGEVTISTEGDAQVDDLDDLFGEFGRIFEQGSGPFGDLFDDEQFDELFDDDFFQQFDDDVFDGWPRLESLDVEAIESCIDEVLGD